MIITTISALLACASPVGGRSTDPLLATIRKELTGYGNYDWKVHRLVKRERQKLTVTKLDSTGISITVRLADEIQEPGPFIWQALRTWSSTWDQLTKVNVDGKLPAGNAVIWLTSERQTAKGPIDLFCDFSILDVSAAQRIADELRQAAAKFHTP